MAQVPEEISDGHATRDEAGGHRRQSLELWEGMAASWERRRLLMWRSTREVGEWLVRRVDARPGQTLLELAAGTGETGLLAARRVGSHGRVIVSDFSPQMVRAAQRAAAEQGVTNAEFRVLDAERLDLEDGSVDGVLCRFGYMLVAEPLRALRETRRVLRHDGRVAFCTWGPPARNPWMTLSAGLLIERGVLDPPAPGGPGVFSMPDADTIVPLVARAGFDEVEVEEMEVAWRFEDADELWAFASELQGPVAMAIARLDERDRREVRADLRQRAAPYAQGGGYELPGLSINVAARSRPGAMATERA